MITEHTDNQAYIRWIYRNPAYNHVSPNGKVSADSLSDLVRWAEERGHTVVECTTCLPYDRK